jgi:hypothetical protein
MVLISEHRRLRGTAALQASTDYRCRKPTAIAQFGGQLGISSLIGFDVVGKSLVALQPGSQRARRCMTRA